MKKQMQGHISWDAFQTGKASHMLFPLICLIQLESRLLLAVNIFQVLTRCPGET